MDRIIKFLNCTEGINYDWPTELNVQDLEFALKTLLRYGFDSDLGDNKIIFSCFALCDEDILPELNNIPGFMPINMYADKIKTRDKEYGSIGHIRFIQSNYNISGNSFSGPSTNKRSIYNIFISVESDTGNTQILNLRCTLK